MVSLKNPIIIKKVNEMKDNQQQRQQKAWERSQEILALRKESEESQKSLRITLEARRRFCRGF